METLTFAIPTIAIIFSIIHSSFIYINYFLWFIQCYLFSKLLPFNFISFLITISFFFRVNPILFKALDIVRLLIFSGHSSAIST